jgi:hypothetical protein
MNPVEEPNYHWEEKQIGEIGLTDLSRFIEWAKSDYGNNIIEIKAISGAFDIFKEVARLIGA